MTRRTNRRNFLKSTAAASVAGFWVAGRNTSADELASKSPSERINIASIGIGGKGDGDSEQASKHGNLIAICDVDDMRLERKGKFHPKAERFNDFRKLFDKLGKDIDAVTISTPDFTHAVATMMAIKMGKAVYTQKPLTHDVFEARQLRLAAREYKVSSQMGNQGTSTDGIRAGVEAIRAGAIGAVTEVHVWTDRPTNWWPQSPDIRQRPPEMPVPSYLHWDEWLGTAPFRPYAEITDSKLPKKFAKPYHPHNWRGWWDFGCGALGDMGCHTVNLPFMALKLAHPSTIVAESEELNSETYPAWARVTYEFPQRGELPPVKLRWYEGHQDGKLVQPPQELVEKVVAEHNKILVARKDKRVKDGKVVGLQKGGSIMVGTKGILYSPGDYGNEWYLLPADTYHDFQAPARTLPRNSGSGNNDEDHKIEWLAAIKGGPKAMSNFDYSGMLSETILLGNVAIRAGGTKLEWDGPNMKFPNAPKVEALLKREYRSPWSL
jgi:predicted dehydrogenase